MEGFTLIDGVVALVIVLSAILAYSRGLVRESLAIAGWAGAAMLAYAFAGKAQPLIKGFAADIPKIGPAIAESCELSIIVSFAAVFAIGLVIAALFSPLMSSLVQRSIFGGLDQGLGFLFGVVRGVLLVAVAFIVYDKAVAANTISMVDNSRSAKVFASFQTNIDDNIPSDAPGWVVARYEALTNVCAPTAEATPAETAPTAPAAGN